MSHCLGGGSSYMMNRTPSRPIFAKSMSVDGLPQIRQTALGERLPQAFTSSNDLSSMLLQRRKAFDEISESTQTLLTRSFAQMSTPEPSLVEQLLVNRFHRVKKRKKKKLKALNYDAAAPTRNLGVRSQASYEVYWDTITDEEARPGAREGAAMISCNGKVILMGGSSRQIYSDMWVLLLDYNRWTKAEVHSHEMIPRTGHSLVEFNQQVVVFGGETSSLRFTNHRECLNTVALLNPGIMDLRSVSTSGQSVVMRRYHCAAEIGKHLFVHGGLTEKNQVLNDVLVLNLSTWKWRKIDTVGEAPGPRAFHTAVGVYNYPKGYSKPGGQSERRVKEFGIYVFGGKDSRGTSYNTLHIIKLNVRPYTWTLVRPLGALPEPRFHHTMTYFQDLCMIVVYGGRQDTRCESGYRCFGDVHLLHLDTLSWTTAQPRGAVPESRCGHAAAALGSRLIVFGGIHNSHYASNDTYELELDSGRVSGMIERDRERELKKKQVEMLKIQSEFGEMKNTESGDVGSLESSSALKKLLLGLRKKSTSCDFPFFGRVSFQE